MAIGRHLNPLARDRPVGLGRAWLVQGVLALIGFMTLMESNALNLALPAIGRDLDAGMDELLWIGNVYLLVLAGFLVTAGRLGDLYGRNRIFLLGLAVFGAGSVVAASAGSIGVLLAARVIQGLGAAVLTPQSLAITAQMFPAEARGRALAITGAASGIGLAAGPTVGGFLVAAVGWRSIFWVNMPIVVLGMVLFRVLAPELPGGRRERLDLLGAGLLATALMLITFGLLEGVPLHWGTMFGPVTIPALIVAGVVVLAGFALVERARQDRAPLLNFAMLRNRTFTLMVLATGPIPCAVSGVMFLCSVWLQSGAGMSPARAGLLLAIAPAVSVPISTLGGRLTDRFGGKPTTMAALILMIGGMAEILGAVGLRHADWWLSPGLAMFGTGMGVGFAGPFSVAISDVPSAMAGAASGVFSTVQRTGNVLGLAAVGAVLQGYLHRGLATAIWAALLLAVLLLAVSLALTAGVSSRPKGETRQPRPGARTQFGQRTMDSEES